MKQKKLFAWLITIVVLLGLVNIGGLYMVSTAQLNSADVESIVSSEFSEFTVPTATEIANKVNIPDVSVPEFSSDERVLDLWEETYSTEISSLEDAAYNDSLAELQEDDYEELSDWLESQIEDFNELEDVEINVDDSEAQYLLLGLEEDADKTAEVVYELDIEYTLVDGPIQDYKDSAIATASVVYDEGDFDDEEIDLVYAFA